MQDENVYNIMDFYKGESKTYALVCVHMHMNKMYLSVYWYK